jgi:hypothetical protein
VLQEAALHRYAPRIPASLRSQTLALFAQLLAFDRSTIANAPSDTLCLVSVGGNNSGTGCGLTSAEIRERGSGLSDDSATVSEVVPDGVATVTLRFPAAQGRPAYSVTGRVVGNLMAVRAPHMLGGSSDQPPAAGRRPRRPGQGEADVRADQAIAWRLTNSTNVVSPLLGLKVSGLMISPVSVMLCLRCQRDGERPRSRMPCSKRFSVT